MPSRSGQAKSLSCDQAHIDTSRWMHRAAGTVMNAPGAGLQGPASTAARNGMTLDRRRGPSVWSRRAPRAPAPQRIDRDPDDDGTQRSCRRCADGPGCTTCPAGHRSPGSDYHPRPRRRGLRPRTRSARLGLRRPRGSGNHRLDDRASIRNAAVSLRVLHDLVELLNKCAVIELHGVQICRPAHRVLRD